MRRRFGLAAIGAVLALALAPVAAGAAEPPSLGSGYVLDAADVLSDGEEQAANERLEELASEGDVELWVVFVDEFTNPSDSGAWADQTAESNGLGQAQYLLAVATEGRQLYLSAPAQGALSESSLVAVEQAAGGALGGNDWAGAVDAAADELHDRSQPNTTTWWIVGGIVVVAIVVIVALGLVGAAKKRRKAREAREKLAAEVDALRSEASGMLIEMDDALHTAEQEAGFAVAEFGADAVDEFRVALKNARGALDAAFVIQRELDDETPESLEEQRDMHGEIISLLSEADTALDDKADDFDELRALAKGAPQALARIEAQRREVDTAPARASAELARLRQTYAADALADVEDNDAQATARLEFVDLRLTEARGHLDDDDAGEAALDLHEAEQALDQAVELVAAVMGLERAFGEAEDDARATIADLERDIAQARAIEDPNGTLAQTVASVQAHIDTARTRLSGTDRTPLEAAEALDEANDRMDAAIGAAREAAENRRRQAHQLDTTLRQAGDRLAHADTLVRTRRGGVGASARAHLARARSALDQAHALRASDPAGALREARRAREAAGRAASTARSDARRYAAGGFGSSRRGAGIGGNIVGGIIGGLIGNALAGGSRRGSGWGRSSRRGIGGFSAGRSRSGGGRRF